MPLSNNRPAPGLCVPGCPAYGKGYPPGKRPDRAAPAMQIEDTALSGVLILTPQRHGDARGFFAETWNRRRM